MSRTRYLVSYDISNPKRLRKVARSLEGFGVRLQYSVFECPLDGVRLAQLKAALHELLNHDEDQVLFVSLGSSAGDATLVIEAMGFGQAGRSRRDCGDREAETPDPDLQSLARTFPTSARL